MNGGKNLSWMQKIYSSLLAGGVGSLIGTPADLILVRMQNDTILPPAQRRNYKHVGDAISKIVRNEGFFSLWKGCTPTVVRAMALNLVMFVSYEECKERLDLLMGKERTNTVWFLSSMIAATLASCASLPFDNIKTKLQKMQPN